MGAMGGGQEVRNFLISYTAADLKWARWINWVLKSRGYTTFIQDDDFIPGHDLTAWIDDVVTRAERTIAVLSPDYMESRYGKPEWGYAWAKDPHGTDRKLIVVQVAACERKGLLEMRPPIDLVGVTDEGQARHKLIGDIERVLSREPGPQEPAPYPGVGALEPGPGFPAVRTDELDPHFDRGTVSFVGRRHALLNLSRWLKDHSDVGPRIVIGGPGSGKTALLGLLASHVGGGSHPATRELLDLTDDELPPSGSISVAVYAGGMQAHEVLASLASAAGVDADEVSRIRHGSVACAVGLLSLLARLAERAQPLVALIDGLDEAAFPSQLTNDVLKPLLDEPYRGRIRLLFGTRAHVAGALGFGTEAVGGDRNDDRIVNLDRPPYADREALGAVVLRTLLGESGDDQADVAESGWQTAPARVRNKAVEVIVELTTPSFYLAQAVASAQARARQLPDPHDPAWQADLPRGSVEAMRRELEARLGDQAGRAADLLLPLAYARGDGLPRSYLWWDLANALVGSHSYGLNDLNWLWENTASYLVETETEGEHRASRLYHQLLADCLKTDRDDKEDERTVARVLSRHVKRDGEGRREWAKASPYTRRHLIEHAVVADVADELIQDPGFLLNAGSAELLASLDKLDEIGRISAQLRAVTDAYRDALPQMRTGPAAERPAYLQLAARCRQADGLAAQIDQQGIDAPWRTIWASWRRQVTHRRIVAHKQPVRAVAVAKLDGVDVVVSASDDDAVRVVTLATGEEQEPLRGYGAAVGTLAVHQRPDGKTLVAAAGDGIAVIVWDLASRQLHRAPFTEHKDWVRAVAFARYGNRTVVISGGDDATIWIWDAETGRPVGDRVEAHRAAVVALAVVPRPGSPEGPLIVSSSEDGEVLVWALDAYQAKPRTYQGHGRAVTALAVGALNGAPVVVSGGGDRTIQVWDPTTLQPVTTPLTGHSDGIRAVTIARAGDRAVVVSGSDDTTSRVWHLATGQPLGAPITVHADAVRALVTAERDGRHVVISGSVDGTVREWELAPGGAVGEPFAGHTRPIRALAIADVGTGQRLISGGSDGKVRLWDPSSGYPVGPELTDHDNWVGAVAVATVDGQPAIVSASGDATAMIWDPAGNQPPRRAYHGDAWIGALAIAELNGSDVVISAGADYDEFSDSDGQPGAVERRYVARVWNPTNGAPIATYTGHSSWIRALAVADGGEKPVVVSAGDDGSLHAWDPASGEPEPIQPAARHEGTVRAIAIDGRSAISAGDDDMIRVCELGSRLPGLAWEAGSGGVNALAVSSPPDTDTVVISAGLDGSISFWSLVGGLSIESQSAHQGAARALAVGTLRGRPAVFSAGDDAMVRAWDVATGTSLMSMHSDWVRCVAVAESPGHEPMVVSGSDDASIGLWDRRTGTPHHTRLAGHRGPVRTVTTATLAGAPVVISGGIDGTIRVWDLVAGKPLLPVLRGHTDWVRSVAVAALPDDRQVIIACGDDAAITIWDLETGAALGAVRTGHTRGVRALAVSCSPGGAFVVSGGADGSVRRAALTPGRRTSDELLGTRRRGVSSIASIELSGRSAVVCGDEGGEVVTWDVSTGEVLGADSYPTGEISAVATAAASRRRDATGQPLLAVAAGATVTLSSWQPKIGWRPLVAPTLNSEILAATFAADDRWVVLATKLGIVMIDFSRYRDG